MCVSLSGKQRACGPRGRHTPGEACPLSTHSQWDGKVSRGSTNLGCNSMAPDDSFFSIPSHLFLPSSHPLPFVFSLMLLQVFLAVVTFLLTFSSEGYAVCPSLEAVSGITAKVSTPPPARSPYRRERSSLLDLSSRDSATLWCDETELV